MKLALGTVQFGLDYGIANDAGRATDPEIAAILATSRQAGIDMLDTAIAYGDSESRLGAAGVSGFSVISKLPALDDELTDIPAAVEGALARLGLPRLYGLLLHRAEDLLRPNGARIYAALQAVKARGLVEKIGISIYDPAELDVLLPRFSLDLVQAPYNVIDRRLQSSGWLDRLGAANVEVHTRSTFLQGLLLMPPERRPAKFAPWARLWSRWDGWLRETGLTPLQATLGFACGNAAIDRVLVGVDSANHLAEIIAAARAPGPAAPDDLASDDRDLINPSHWASLAAPAPHHNPL